MKKFRLIAIICLICISAMMLSSCKTIDDLKEQRFVFTNEDFTEIEYKGVKYIQLDNARGLSVNRTSDLQGWVVEEDVPLLLIDTFGYMCRIDFDLGVISVGDTLYCTEEKYDEYSSLMKTAKLDHYKIDYEFYDYYEETTEYFFTVLDDKATELINGTLANVVGKEQTDEDGIWSADIMYLDRCDSTGFVHEADVFELYRNKEKDVCGLRVYDDISGVYVMYEFPDEHEQLIEKLFDDYYHSGIPNGVYTDYEYSY